MDNKKEKIKIEDWKKGISLTERDDHWDIKILYPRQKDIQHIVFNICDVRASDGIRISYDFGRDGYKIEQPTQLEWVIDEKVDMKWKEVAFIQSWALEEEQKKNSPLEYEN